MKRFRLILVNIFCIIVTVPAYAHYWGEDAEAEIGAIIIALIFCAIILIARFIFWMFPLKDYSQPTNTITSANVNLKKSIKIYSKGDDEIGVTNYNNPNILVRSYRNMLPIYRNYSTNSIMYNKDRILISYDTDTLLQNEQLCLFIYRYSDELIKTDREYLKNNNILYYDSFSSRWKIIDSFSTEHILKGGYYKHKTEIIVNQLLENNFTFSLSEYSFGEYVINIRSTIGLNYIWCPFTIAEMKNKNLVL